MLLNSRLWCCSTSRRRLQASDSSRVEPSRVEELVRVMKFPLFLFDARSLARTRKTPRNGLVSSIAFELRSMDDSMNCRKHMIPTHSLDGIPETRCLWSATPTLWTSLCFRFVHCFSEKEKTDVSPPKATELHLGFITVFVDLYV